jgi:hypothetical protein
VEVFGDLPKAAGKIGVLSEYPKIFGERNFALMSTEGAEQNRRFSGFK